MPGAGIAEGGETAKPAEPAQPSDGGSSGTALLRILPTFLGLTVLTAFVVALPLVYVSAERWVYYWDHATFHDLATGLTETFEDTRSGAARQVLRSLGNDYTLVFAVPLVPWLLLDGPSRSVFIVALAVTYLVPFALASGYLVRQLVRDHRTAAFWLGVAGVALLTPAWAPVLRGYPDVGGAAILTLAAAVYLGGPALRDWRRVLLIAVLITLAPIFRRTFAYGSLALVAAMGLHIFAVGLARVRRERVSAMSALVLPLGRVVILVGLAAATMWLLARPFVESVIGTDFGALYASYRIAPADVLAFFWSWVGPLPWLLAGLGLAWAWWSGGVDRPAVGFAAAFGALALLAWVFGGAQTNAHYAYLFLPAVATGIALLAHRLIRLAGQRRSALAIAGAAAGAAFAVLAVTLSPPPASPASWASPAAALLPGSVPPLVRSDLPELDRLVRHLRATAAGQPTYVVASSFFFNAEIVRQTERQRFAGQPPALELMQTPDIDSRDTYPVSNLALAEVVVLAEPFQHHLAPDEQRVVRAAWEAFAGEWEISHDYERQPEAFRIEHDVAVSLLRRTRAASPDVVWRTLERTRALVGRVPGAQPAWVAVRAPGGRLSIERQGDGTSQVAGRVEPTAEGQIVLLATAPAGTPSTASTASIRGRIAFGKPCAGVALTLREHRAGSPETVGPRVERRGSDAAAFELRPSGPPADYITLEVASLPDPPATAGAAAAPGGCDVTLDALALGPAPG